MLYQDGEHGEHKDLYQQIIRLPMGHSQPHMVGSMTVDSTTEENVIFFHLLYLTRYYKTVMQLLQVLCPVQQ